MARMVIELSGLVISFLGFVASIVICALPSWKVTSFQGSSTTAAQSYTDGLFMTCAYDSMGQAQCRSYNSLLELTPDLIVGRVMVVYSIITSYTAYTFYFIGRDFTTCVSSIISKRFVVVAGSLLVTSGFLVMVPISLTTNDIMNNFYAPMVPEAVSRELGASGYIAWISSVLLILGGFILCRVGNQVQQDSYLKNYREVKTCGPTGYPMKDYV